MPKTRSNVTNPQAQEFYNIASNSDRILHFVPKSFQPLRIKQGQTNPTLWHKLGGIVPVLAICFNIFFKDSLTVTIHGRQNK
jgi:hypothetical protein